MRLDSKYGPKRRGLHPRWHRVWSDSNPNPPYLIVYWFISSNFYNKLNVLASKEKTRKKEKKIIFRQILQVRKRKNREFRSHISIKLEFTGIKWRKCNGIIIIQKNTQLGNEHLLSFELIFSLFILVALL